MNKEDLEALSKELQKRTEEVKQNGSLSPEGYFTMFASLLLLGVLEELEEIKDLITRRG